MKSRGLIYFGAALLLAAVVLLGISATSQAQTATVNPTRGALLYDKWYAVLGVQAPTGNMPIWARQTTDTHAGEDTWRCASCHGWDYQGKDGAYRSGAHYTGFPGLTASLQAMSNEDVVAALKGKKDPQHDFSAYLDDASLNDLAAFLKTGLPDDSKYIDPVAMTVIGGDRGHGQSLYSAQCASCHAEDGAKLPFRFEGRDATVGTIAKVDPWRVLHKIQFGHPGTQAASGSDLKWTLEDSRDVLLYAQSLPTGLVATSEAPSVGGALPEISGTGPAGQSQGLFVGLVTALGAMFTGLGFALILGVFLVGVIFIIVWSLRDRKK